ncbi:hypothetical protein EYW49_02120 [Siculibacillus lacustris]|uniref:PepSY domain-containing protein n=1 Tax=Siculibacillus lacustris TaxID=1549641 RepID=A0A4Q9VYA4_9HYPH|nr:hypothetical protein [Siculibacillus lacustris]TBW40975.1 hypothetical protein EYW49_02120 [Siculibacillus lacustris]
MKRLLAVLALIVSSLPVAAEEPLLPPGNGGRSLTPPAEIVCLGTAAAQGAIRDGRARRFAEVGRDLDGDLLRADLCRSDDTLLYRVTVLDHGGRVRRLQIDATSGRMMYDGR